MASSVLLLVAPLASAQGPTPCRVLCSPEFNVEPTITFTNVFGSARILREDGIVTRSPRQRQLEVILSLGMPTRVSWLEFTVETILPFVRDSTPELELEANFVWLRPTHTNGWLSSHLDVVDKFSPAERLMDRRAYTHKLNLELDTSLAIFSRMSKARWLRGVEVEGSLDYVATGLPRAGDEGAPGLYLDDASPWSFSLVVVLPVAPM